MELACCVRRGGSLPAAFGSLVGTRGSDFSQCQLPPLCRLQCRRWSATCPPQSSVMNTEPAPCQLATNTPLYPAFSPADCLSRSKSVHSITKCRALDSESNSGLSDSGGVKPPLAPGSLQIGTPIVITEAPPFVKSADPMPMLRENKGQIKEGDVGR